MRSRVRKISEMSALTIIQPWAQCIVRKGKNVENRDWSTNYRGTIAIHASKKKDIDRFDHCKAQYKVNLDPDQVPYGVIVGFANIVDVIDRRSVNAKTRKWFSGKYGFVLENIVVLKEPIKAKGALTFWKLKGKPLRDCLSQISSSHKKRFKKFLKTE
jgi:hypothetical protein